MLRFEAELSAEQEEFVEEVLSARPRVPWNAAWEERAELPVRRGGRDVLVEVGGLARAGKDSALADLEGHLARVFPGRLVKVVGEFGNLVGEYQRMRVMFSRDIYTTMSLANLTKVLSVGVMRRWSEVATKPSIIVFERGVVDVLAMDRAIDGLVGRGPLYVDKGVVDWERGAVRRAAAALLDLPDAVILFGVGVETAMERRRAQGQPPAGMIVDPEVWPAWELGYKWWLEYVYPLMRERFGTGLLVINGEKGMEENNAIVRDYLERVVGVSGRGRRGGA